MTSEVIIVAVAPPVDVAPRTRVGVSISRRWVPIAAGAALVAAPTVVFWRWTLPVSQPIAALRSAPPTQAAQATGTTARMVTLAVLPFESVGEDAALRELAAGLTDGFGESLSRIADLRVTSAESTAIAVAAAPEPRAVARALSVEHVLTGRLRATDASNLELELALYAATSPDRVWSHVVRHTRAQPFRILGPALDAIVASPLRRQGGARLDPALNASLDAQDLYWLGRQQLVRRDVEAWRRALVLFERAVEIDASFALAWTGVSASHLVLANEGQEPLQTSAQAASMAVERALALDPNLTEAYVEKSLISTMQWRAIEGRAAAQRAMELSPNHPGVLAINGSIESYLARPRAAYALHQRARAGNPLPPLPLSMLGQDCIILGDESCAYDHFAEARRFAGQRAPYARQGRFALAFGHVAAAATAESTDVAFVALYPTLERAQAWSMLGFDAESARVLARLGAPRSAVPLRLTVNLDRHWRQARWAEALTWADGVVGSATQEPWRAVWLAQARVLAGDTAKGLRDYNRILADVANRALLTYSWFPTRIGIGQIANWIALRKQSGESYQAELAALNSDIAAMAEGGVDIPAFDYHCAVAAALAGDVATADSRLGRAIERGWLDEVAFTTDFVWRDFAEAPWLEAHRVKIRSRLATERAAALAAMPAAK